MMIIIILIIIISNININNNNIDNAVIPHSIYINNKFIILTIIKNNNMQY